MNTQNTQPKAKTYAELKNDLEAAEGKFKNGGYKQEDYDTVKSIQAAIKKFDDEKKINIENIVKQIDGFGFTLTDIFTSYQIKKAGFVKEATSTDSTTTGTASTEPKKERAKRTPRPSDDEIVLFSIPNPNGRGKGFDYPKGRIYENANIKATKPEAPYTAVSKLLAEKVKSKEDLLKIVSVANKEKATAYLNTPEGKKEVNAIIAFIKDNTLTTDKLKAIA